MSSVEADERIARGVEGDGVSGDVEKAEGKVTVEKVEERWNHGGGTNLGEEKEVE